MIKFDLELELLEEELKQVDILDVRDVRLDTRVDLESGLNVDWLLFLLLRLFLGFLSFPLFYRVARILEMIVRLAKVSALGLQDHGEERLTLPMVIDLNSMEDALVDPLLPIRLNHHDPLVEHQGQHLYVLIDQRHVHLADVQLCLGLLLGSIVLPFLSDSRQSHRGSQVN